MEEPNPIEKHDQDLAEHKKKQSLALVNLGGILSAILTVVLCTVITYTAHFTFGFFKILFGVLVGFGVKRIGKGSGTLVANTAGLYAVAAVIGYEWILATFFIAGDDPSLLPGRHDEESKAFMQMAYSYSRLVHEPAAAAFAYILAFRIAKNPMKKDELDYLLEAKGVSPEVSKYPKEYFKKKRRR
jgi:hypothetical protein